MICPSCGATIADKAIVCYRCGAPTAPPAGRSTLAARRGIRPLVVGAVVVAILLAVILWVLIT
jgi:hypothetical protein